MTIINTMLVATATFAALMSGLFFAYTASVSPGLGRLPDAGYLSAMQQINRAIQNPVFFVVFFGCLVLLPLSTFLQYGNPITARVWLLLAATVVYLVGVFGTTVLGNIPLNNMLDSFDIPSATEQSLRAQRASFEQRWNLFNDVRTVASLVTVVLVILACMSPGRQAATVATICQP
jgi:uncharacterized membrane protein